jgi:hypothetical protein
MGIWRFALVENIGVMLYKVRSNADSNLVWNDPSVE